MYTCYYPVTRRSFHFTFQSMYYFFMVYLIGFNDYWFFSELINFFHTIHLLIIEERKYYAKFIRLQTLYQPCMEIWPRLQQTHQSPQ